MVAQGDRYEADAVGVRARGLREVENAVRRERADGQVVVAGPAEAAQVCAAADHLDQEARAEFCVGREDARRRRIERVSRPDGRLAHRHRRLRRRALGRRRIAGEPAVDAVLWLVERGNVESALAG